MFLAAAFASELPNVQRHLGVDVSTGGASLTRREEAVCVSNFPAIPSGLVFKHLPEHSEAGATDVLSELPVANHAAHVQVLDSDHIEPAHQVRGQLVQRVLPAISDVRLMPCYLALLQFPSVAAFHAPGEHPLQLCQLRGVLGGVSRVGYTLPIGQRSQPRYSQVDPDLPARLWERDLVRFLQTKAHEISPATILGYRDCGWLARELAAPHNGEATDFGNRKVAVDRTPLERVCRVFSGLLPVLGAEFRVPCTLGKKIGEGRLQVTQRLLLGRARAFAEECKLRIVAMLRPLPRTGAVVDRQAVFEAVSPQPKRKIESVTSTAELPRKLPLLAITWIDTECLPYFHTPTMPYVKSNVNCKSKSA